MQRAERKNGHRRDEAHARRFILGATAIGLGAGLASGQAAFDGTVTMPVGSQPGGAATADFNGDGFLDLAMPVEAPDRIAIMLGDGAGAFVAGGSAIMPNSSSPGEVQAADLDGDGDIDLMVTLKDLFTVGFVRNDGGVFSLVGQFSTGDESRGLSLADYDGDGDIDAVTANRRDDTATILTNIGGGAFASQTVAVPGGDPRAATFGDFDGDGIMEVAISLSDLRQIALFDFNGASFAAAGSRSTGAGLRPEGLASADFDGNGFDDLAVAANGAALNGALVFLSDGTLATGGALTAVAGQDASDIEIGEFSCDEAIDLALVDGDGSSLSLLTNNGAGAFTLSASIATGLDPDRPAVGDFDGDRDDDIAVPSNAGNSVMIASTACGTGGGGGGPICGDGICEPGEDPTCIDCNGGGGGPVGSFTFAPRTSIAVGTQPSPTAAIDVNGDGRSDLVVAVDDPDRLQVLIANEDGSMSLGPIVLLPASSSPQDVVSGDFDGDGDDDLAVTLRDANAVQFVMNTKGGLVPGTSVAVGTEPRAASASDANGDGIADVAVVSRDFNTFSTLVSGAGSFAVTTVDVGSEPRMAVFIDGRVAVSLHDERRVALFPIGSNVESGSLSTGALVRPEGLATGDLDGDGDDELLAATNGGGFESVTTWTNDGGVFGAGVAWATSVPDTSEVAVADLDCDGDLEIVASGRSADALAVFALAILANDGAGTFGPPSRLETGTRPERPIAADFDGDGDADLAVSDPDANTVSTWINETCTVGDPADLDGNGIVDGADLSILLGNWGFDGAGDLDGNGTVGGADLTILLSSFTL